MFPWFTDKSASVHCTVLWEVNPRTHRGKSSTPFYWQNCRCPPHAAAAQGLATSRASSAGAPRLQRCRDPKGTDCSSQLYSPKNVNPCFQITLISSITKYLVNIKSLFWYLPWKNIQLNDPIAAPIGTPVVITTHISRGECCLGLNLWKSRGPDSAFSDSSEC